MPLVWATCVVVIDGADEAIHHTGLGLSGTFSEAEVSGEGAGIGGEEEAVDAQAILADTRVRVQMPLVAILTWLVALAQSQTQNTVYVFVQNTTIQLLSTQNYTSMDSLTLYQEYPRPL